MKAFPIDYNTASVDKWQGMDLRDYFAAHAPLAPDWFAFSSYETYTVDMNYGTETCRKPTESQMDREMRWRYEYADSMMKAREQ